MYDIANIFLFVIEHMDQTLKGISETLLFYSTSADWTVDHKTQREFRLKHYLCLDKLYMNSLDIIASSEYSKVTNLWINMCADKGGRLESITDTGLIIPVLFLK